MISTHPIITLRAPNGVTRIGGAKEYAAKFATEHGTVNLNLVQGGRDELRCDSRSPSTTDHRHVFHIVHSEYQAGSTKENAKKYDKSELKRTS